MPSYPIPSCPATIDPPNANGFSLEVKKSKDGIQTEMGSTRTRRQNTTNVYVVKCELYFFSYAKFHEFMVWLKYETNYGNLWFKANWFSALGFTAGDWVFRFVDLPFANSGYSQVNNITLLMAPYNTNVVSADYTEIGVGGEFINSIYPFNWEQFQCIDLQYYRTFRFNGQTSRLACIDWNESNWTIIGAEFDLSATVEKYNVRSISVTKKDCVAVINGNVSCKLGMYKFSNNAFALLGTETVLTGYSTLKSKIARLSDSRIALYDGGLKTLTTWEFNYTLNTWAIVGSSFSLATYITGLGSPQDCICSIGNNRIAFVYHEANGSGTSPSKLVTFSFSGSAWSQVGNKLTIYANSSASYSISGMSLSEIVLTHDINAYAFHTYEKRLTKFTFDGTNWSAGNPSLQFPNGAIPRVSAIDSDKVGVSRSDGTDIGMIEAGFDGTTFVDNGVFLKIPGVASNDALTSFLVLK